MRAPSLKKLLVSIMAASLTATPKLATAQNVEKSATAQNMEVVPPRLVEDAGVSYPRSALEARYYEEEEVVLILELDEKGHVVSASVEGEPERWFEREALAAATRSRFEPAMQGGAPVPARIRFRYLFVPPPPTLLGRVLDSTGEPISGARVVVHVPDSELSVETELDGSWRASGVAYGLARVLVVADGYEPETAETRLEPGRETRLEFRLESIRRPANEEERLQTVVDVTVRGEPPPPATSSYTRAEVRRIPGAFGDPFRAVETFPGVTPVAAGLPFFYVRGAPPGNVGYFVDGVRVPYLHHAGFGPSVIHPAFIDSVTLHPGGYPAKLGRFSGGIVSASTTEPSPEFHGETSLRLFDVGGYVEMGFDEGRGTALAGGRYSYAAALVSLIVPQLTLDYRDYQARVSYDLTADDRLSIVSFGAYDLLGQTKNDVLDVLFGTEFYRVDLRYDRSWSAGRLRTAVTFGYDRTSAGFLAAEQRNVIDRSVAARTELVSYLGERTLLRGGTDLAVNSYRIQEPRYPSDLENPEIGGFRQLVPERTDLTAGAWVDLTVDVTQGLQVTPGMRADLYRSGDLSAVGIEPRLAARWAMASGLRFVPAFGMAHQPPSYVIPVPGVTPSLEQGLQRNIQSSAGIELDLDEASMVGSTLFYNVLSNMTDAISSATTEGGAPDFRHRARGTSFGAEFFLRRRMTKRLGGFISYTLARSERSSGGGAFASAFDRTHVLNAAASYGLGRGWTAGCRFVFLSGAPMQRPAGPAGQTPIDDVRRDSPFIRLDLRLEKRWALSSSAWVSFVAEVMNATLSPLVIGGEEVGPFVLPSLGVEAGF